MNAPISVAEKLVLDLSKDRLTADGWLSLTKSAIELESYDQMDLVALAGHDLD